MSTRAVRASVAGGGLLLTTLLLATALMLSGGVGGAAGGGPAIAGADCASVRGDVEVVSHFPKPFASQYKKKLRVQVFNRTGNVKKWHVELYTYSGFLLGKSKKGKWLNWGDRAAIKLRQSMQPGPYTVVLKGTVAGCSESQYSDVVKLKNCLSKLPVVAFNKPGGTASDYGNYLTIGIKPRPEWSPIRNIKSTVYDFDGVKYGKAELPRGQRKLIGEAYLNNKLTRPLKAGGYSVVIEGKAPQPRACGDKNKTVTLEFK